MTTTLYADFSEAIQSLPEADLIDTIERLEHAITQACRVAKADTLFVPVGVTRLPVDGVLRVLAGHTLAEIADVWATLRGELADLAAHRGADAALVAELRDGGPRP